MTPVRRPSEPTPPQRLRELARRVSRLACSGRTDPESVVIEKISLSAELSRLARELERAA